MQASDLQPVVFVTTVQPYLLFWVSVISFFVALSVVAAFSRNRRWHELLAIFALSFVLSTTGGVFATQWLTSIDLVQLEVISLKE
ncbi:MAG: hypothetical protein ACQEVA_04605 [Myxococcota bacterium]